jgi:hypothetical protein
VSEKIPEVTPEKVRDDVEVVLLMGSKDRDSQAYIMAFTETMAGSAEMQARNSLGNSQGDYMRHAAIVRVRVPRSLLRERWTEASS